MQPSDPKEGRLHLRMYCVGFVFQHRAERCPRVHVGDTIRHMCHLAKESMIIPGVIFVKTGQEMEKCGVFVIEMDSLLQRTCVLTRHLKAGESVLSSA